jgi:hypothetical protein
MKSDALRTPAGLRMVILALVVHLALIIACFLFKVPDLSSLSFSLFLLFSSTKSQCRGFQITSLPPTASRKLLLQTSQFSKNWTRSQHSSRFVRLCCLTRKKMDLAHRLGNAAVALFSGFYKSKDSIPKSYYRHVYLTAVRTLMRRTSVRQQQYVSWIFNSKGS